MPLARNPRPQKLGVGCLRSARIGATDLYLQFSRNPSDGNRGSPRSIKEFSRQLRCCPRQRILALQGAPPSAEALLRTKYNFLCNWRAHRVLQK
jgi:hypothetical protein